MNKIYLKFSQIFHKKSFKIKKISLFIGNIFSKPRYILKILTKKSKLWRKRIFCSYFGLEETSKSKEFGENCRKILIPIQFLENFKFSSVTCFVENIWNEIAVFQKFISAGRFPLPISIWMQWKRIFLRLSQLIGIYGALIK